MEDYFKYELEQKEAYDSKFYMYTACDPLWLQC